MTGAMFTQISSVNMARINVGERKREKVREDLVDVIQHSVIV